jgi:hypothetical protein
MRLLQDTVFNLLSDFKLASEIVFHYKIELIICNTRFEING